MGMDARTGRGKENTERKVTGTSGIGWQVDVRRLFLHAFGNWHIGRLCRMSSSILYHHVTLQREGKSYSNRELR